MGGSPISQVSYNTTQPCYIKVFSSSSSLFYPISWCNNYPLFYFFINLTRLWNCHPSSIFLPCSRIPLSTFNILFDNPQTHACTLPLLLYLSLHAPLQISIQSPIGSYIFLHQQNIMLLGAFYCNFAYLCTIRALLPKKLLSASMPATMTFHFQP